MSPVAASIERTATPVAPGPRRVFLSTAKWLLLFLAALAGLYAVYGGVNITFFRAENGGYERVVSQGWPVIRAQLFKDLVTSHGGHYTPLFFWFELGSTVLCGTSALCWRLRQLTILALLLLALCSFFGQAASRYLSARTRWLLALGLSAPVVLSPRIIGFVGWPIESGQLLWALFTVLSLGWLSKVAFEMTDRDLPLRPLWISLAFGYASMHMLGLGLATMAGWFAAYAVLLLTAWQRGLPKPLWRATLLPGAVGALLTTVHAVLMKRLIAAPAPGLAPVPPAPPLPHFMAEALGYTIHLLVSCLRALWSPDALTPPVNGQLDVEWPYGLATLLLLVVGGLWAWRHYRARPTPPALCGLCWYSFSLVALFFYLLLTFTRVYRSGGGWIIYLLGDRYLWPPAILLLGFAGAAVLGLRLRDRLPSVVVGLLLLGGTLEGNPSSISARLRRSCGLGRPCLTRRLGGRSPRWPSNCGGRACRCRTFLSPGWCVNTATWIFTLTRPSCGAPPRSRRASISVGCRPGNLPRSFGRSCCALPPSWAS